MKNNFNLDAPFHHIKAAQNYRKNLPTFVEHGSVFIPIDLQANDDILSYRSRSKDECCSLLVDDHEGDEDSTLLCCNWRRGTADVSCDRLPSAWTCDSGLTRFTPNSLTRLAMAWLWAAGTDSRTIDRPPLPPGCTSVGGGPVIGEGKRRSCPLTAVVLGTLQPYPARRWSYAVAIAAPDGMRR